MPLPIGFRVVSLPASNSTEKLAIRSAVSRTVLSSSADQFVNELPAQNVPGAPPTAAMVVSKSRSVGPIRSRLRRNRNARGNTQGRPTSAGPQPILRLSPRTNPQSPSRGNGMANSAAASNDGRPDSPRISSSGNGLNLGSINRIAPGRSMAEQAPLAMVGLPIREQHPPIQRFKDLRHLRCAVGRSQSAERCRDVSN